MKEKAEKIEALNRFKINKKFSAEVWQNRGLNPSSIELSDQLEKTFNLFAVHLAQALEAGSTPQQLTATLKSDLAGLNKLSYDTEEKELICEYFDHLSSIVEVNLSQELNKWLYGSALSALLKVSKKQAIIKEKQAKILKQPCNGCKVMLETKILNKQTGIPENWIIAKCKQCGALNLLILGNDVKELRIINYEPIEFLNASSYTLEEVLSKFNQYGASS